MPLSHVQFQKGLSLPDFLQRFGTEEQCATALESTRWPDGFHCPVRRQIEWVDPVPMGPVVVPTTLALQRVKPGDAVGWGSLTISASKAINISDRTHFAWVNCKRLSNPPSQIS